MVLPLALGPTLAARATANFTVAPLADPWWNLDFEVELIIQHVQLAAPQDIPARFYRVAAELAAVASH